MHFRRYLEDQTLPLYVKQFLEDGKTYINTYRYRGGDFFNKKAIIFFSFFALLIIGGSFFICLWVFPRIWPIVPGRDRDNQVWYNPEWNPTCITKT